MNFKTQFKFEIKMDYQNPENVNNDLVNIYFSN